jgi:hypothetical protein
LFRRHLCCDQREEGLESGSVGFGGVEEDSGGQQSASILASSCLPLAFSCLSGAVSFSISLVPSSIRFIRLLHPPFFLLHLAMLFLLRLPRLGLVELYELTIIE